MKGMNNISWDEYFMGIAELSSLRSKDPSTKVGACIVSPENTILGVGYNGFPKGCEDDKFPWCREGDFVKTKYPYVIHAEQNAILNSFSNLSNSKIYVTLFPCNECAKHIIQKGIKEIIYLSDKYKDSESTIASKIMLNATGVVCRQIKIKDDIKLSFNKD